MYRGRMPHAPSAPGRGTPDFSAASRAALVEALIAAGPGMPTLCEGWRTEHLAAHVHLRETAAVAGLLLPGLRGRLERRTLELGDAHATDRTFADLVDRVERGPIDEPETGGRLRRGALRVAGRVRRSAPVRRVADQMNFLEFFVHTEDVRRAQGRWAPRILADDYADTLWTQLAQQAGQLYHDEDTGVQLERRARPASRTDNTVLTPRTARDGEPTVRIVGPVGELALHAFGRRSAALVLEDRQPA